MPLTPGPVIPPTSPGYFAFDVSNIIVISAGQFMGAARGSLYTTTDAKAPGPSPVRDDQTAADFASAADTLVVDCDLVGVRPSVGYWLIAGYRVIDGGSIAGMRLGTVTGSGLETTITDPVLNISSVFGVRECRNQAQVFGALSNDVGQSFTVKAWHTSGSGGIIIDILYLIPTDTANVYYAAEQFDGSSTPVADAPLEFGTNGHFYQGGLGSGVNVAENSTHDTDPNFVNTAGSIGSANLRHLSFARVTGSGTGHVQARLSGTTMGDVADIPGTGSVYLIDYANPVYGPGYPQYDQWLWADSGAARIVDIRYAKVDNGSPGVGPGVHVIQHIG